MELLQVIRDAKLSAEGYAAAQRAGVCVRCCLRFADVSDAEVYAHSDDKLLDAVHRFQQESNATGLSNGDISAQDGGVLNRKFRDGLLDDVRRKAQESKYDATTFALNIKLPSAVLLREYSLLEHFRGTVDRFPKKNPFDLKDTLKSLIADEISKSFGNATCTNASSFAVLVNIDHDESAEEVKQIPVIKHTLENARKRRRGPAPILDGFGAVNRAIGALTAMPSTIKCPPTLLQTQPTAELVIERDPVYLQGRYLKFKRGLSQSPWVLDGVRMGESSVEECIGDIALPYFRGASYKFHTAGREDVDVRMLGNGRPFILEIIDAKKANLTQEEYQQIQDAVNAANENAVEIRETKASTKEYFAGLQAGADSKKKTYCCVVWSERELTAEAVAKLDAIHDLAIQQETPIRVLHRRTLMTRPKVIHEAKCEVLNKHYMLLRLTTSAGTYVKEFVHGDRGRTLPNVSSILGSNADILQLDVENLLDAA
uniref:tRNA pseudouridine(55) synthase n=1 Tax=Globisporangium ultimum (strain ATCC 200006 / CBS 805.95 / DAOM BR144) TaxID=431595 RepID=K3X1C6_GLOUD